MNPENEPRGHIALVAKNNELRTLVESDLHKTVRSMAEQLGVNYSSVS